MDNLVTISNTKENVLEFDVEIEGIDSNGMSVRFIIEASGVELGFDSKKQTEKKWTVNIPALSILEKTSYPFHIDVIVDGYYFEPLHGSVNVVGTHEVYASKPENVTLAPGKPKPKSVEDIVNTIKADIEPPKEEKVKPPEIPLVKPDRKFVMQPLKVKDGKELFKTLIGTPKVERKTDDKLDDEILGIFKKAKEDKLIKSAKPEKETKPVVQKAAEAPVETKKEVKAKETKKIKPKTKNVSDKEREKGVVVKEQETVLIETLDKPVEEPKERLDAKQLAGNIIRDVTGLGGNKDKEVISENSKDDKIKDIIKEKVVAKNTEQPKEVKEAGAIKKFTKDKKIVTIDESKEQTIKDVLKTDEEETRTITTKPFVKKDVTIH